MRIGSLMRLTQWNGQTHIITIRTSLFLALNLFDFVLTAILIQLGLGVEGNPLLAPLPLWAMGITKLGLAIIVIRLFGRRIGIMRLMNVGIGLVVAWNLYWLLK